MTRPTEDEVHDAADVIERAVEDTTDLMYERDEALVDLDKLKTYAQTMRLDKRIERMAETLNELDKKVWKTSFGFLILGVVLSSGVWLAIILKAL